MAKIYVEDIISWENKNSKTLCPECFEEEFDGEFPVEWTPVLSKEAYEIIYQCDCCGEKSVN
jgi:hypothetical protein